MKTITNCILALAVVAMGCANWDVEPLPGSDASQQDNLPPVVEITAPQGGATFIVGDDISVAVQAVDDDGNVVKVDLYRNEGDNPDKWIAKIEGEHADGIYHFTWENAAAGVHVLHAVATDNDGGLGDSQDVTIVVNQRDVGLPNFTISADSNSVNAGQCTTVHLDIISDVTSCVAIGGNAGDGWAGVTVTADTNREVCPTATTTYGWRCTGLGGSQDRSTTVNVNQSQCTGTLTSNGLFFVVGAGIDLDVQVTCAASTVSRVEFREGTNLLCTDTSGPSPYHCDWDTATVGTHTVHAVVFRTDGSSFNTNQLQLSVVQSSGEVQCHGLGLYFSNAQQSQITRCTKWSKTGVGTDVGKSTFVDGGIGACAITCYDNTGNTVVPQAVTGVWLQNGTSDVTRWYTTGCARLPWHPAAEPDQAGGAWDKLCDRTVTSLSGPPTP